MKRILIWNEDIKERLELSEERICEVAQENELKQPYLLFFQREAKKLKDRFELVHLLLNEEFDTLSEEELKQWNERLYKEEMPSSYERSFVNPAYSSEIFGKEEGVYFSHLAFLLQKSHEYLFSGKIEEFVKLTEFFLECYGLVKGEEGKQALHSSLYYFKRDNLTDQLRITVEEQFTAKETNVFRLINKADLSSSSYLYRFGLYVNEDDLRVSAYLASLSDEEIRDMAKTHVNGFVEGCKTMRVDLKGKTSVKLYAHLGFERLIREEIKQFKEHNLQTFVSLNNEGANRQVEYDHKNDHGLFLDEAYIQHYLDAYEKILSQYKEELKGYGGPAAIETFGEQDFDPQRKQEAVSLDESQRKLFTGFSGKKYQILNRFAPAEERSFTIIAYPLPGISDEKYEEIFKDIIRINNMDNETYRKIQQFLIDELDKGEYVHVKGCGENETDIRVYLHELKNPEKETNFENCVADVNIPVGEVFTSPKLTGTNGVLHVTGVYLNGLLYKNLRLRFVDGKISEYSVKNFEKEEDNKKFIEENLLHQHETLPLGEFAIGTNTLAYMVGMKYHISGKLPILIAEKTGPHFAVGDTCYSMQEEHAVYNPDGKEIVARENECSALRKTDIEHAYFNCHTDITIPYNELGEITVHGKDGREVTLLKNGRFVLPGTLELNKALEEE